MAIRRLARAILVGALLVVGTSPATAGTIIFSNLNNGTYDGGWGASILGPDASDYWVQQGGSFVPTGDYTLGTISAALTHVVGTNAIDLHLMADNSGVPGSTIESWHFEDLPRSGSATNAAFAVAISEARPLLSAGVRYWVVASAQGDSSMTFNFNTLGSYGIAQYREGYPGWVISSGLPTPAFQVESVPDHSFSLVLLGIGLLGCVPGLRRRPRGA